MTIQECYEALGGGYANAVQRFGMEAMVRRFAPKYLQDPTFEALEKCLQAGDTEGAFRQAHTLKGVAKNLSFVLLGDRASELTELLRAGKLQEARDFFPQVRREHERAQEVLKQL